MIARLLALALMLLPAVAAACPACVGQDDRNRNVLVIIGSFMLVPFAVFYVVLRAVRRSLRDDDRTPQ